MCGVYIHVHTGIFGLIMGSCDHVYLSTSFKTATTIVFSGTSLVNEDIAIDICMFVILINYAWLK